MKKVGGLSYKLDPSCERGAPDRVAIFPTGKVVFVELKALNGKVLTIQKYQHQQLELRHANVVVLWSTEDVKAFIERETNLPAPPA